VVKKLEGCERSPKGPLFYAAWWKSWKGANAALKGRSSTLSW